jgi:DNA-binding IclR family transcriptional regulator
MTARVAKTDASPERATYQIRALERGLDIIEAFSVEDPELSLAHIAERTGLPKPTALRLLSVLAQRGYVEWLSATERYRLGVRAFEAGSVYLQSTSIEAEAEPYMRALADTTGQTANLGILDRAQVVHIQVVAPDRPVHYWATVGKREDAHLSGLGKVLMSGLDAPERDAILKDFHFEQRTPKTIGSKQAMQAEIEKVRLQGYALDDEESNLGLRCVAAPIHDGRERIVAALSISGVIGEFSDDDLPRLIAATRDAADSISARLGRRQS